MVHDDRIFVLNFLNSPYTNITTEHPNQSYSDIIDQISANIDETRLIERYMEKEKNESEEYEDNDDDDLDDELLDLSEELDNDSFITFSTDIEPYNETFPPPTTTTTEAPTTTSTTEPTTTEPSTRRPSRKKNKNGRYRGSNSDELELDMRSSTRPVRPKNKLKTTDSTNWMASTSTTMTKQQQKKTTPKESNIQFVRPEKVSESAVPSTPVSTNSKIIEIKPSQGTTKNLSRRLRHRSDTDLEFEIQSVDEDDFIIRDEETGEVLNPSYLVSGAAPGNITIVHRELEGVAGFVQRILATTEPFGE